VYSKLLIDPCFHKLLADIDRDIAEEHRKQGCRACGGKLHSARYPRKPRGSQLPEAHVTTRQSFCCATQGCRRRMTPPSARFLGRKVFFGAAVVLACVLRQGVTAWRYVKLRELFGVSGSTVRRWRRWWLEVFAEGSFWRTVCSRLVPRVNVSKLPLSLLERFGPEGRETLVRLLRFISPVTTSTATGQAP
jgi:hypothetical protein